MPDFLKKFLKTPSSLHTDWDDFANRERNAYSSLVPSVTLQDGHGVLVSDFNSDNTNILDNRAGIAFFKSVTIKQELVDFGIVHIDISGIIYGMNQFISSGKFLRLFGIFNNMELHFGWGESSSLRSTKYSALFSHQPCNMISYHLTYIDSFSYGFKMTMVSNIEVMESNLDISKLSNQFSADDFNLHDLIEENGQFIKKPFTRLSKVLERVQKAINELSANVDGKRAIKEVLFDYAIGTVSEMPNIYFISPNLSSNLQSLGDIKVTLEMMKADNIWKGNLKTFLKNLIDLFPEVIRNKISFYIDESEDITQVKFYNVVDEYDKSKMNDALVIVPNKRNSVVSSINFSYDTPIYDWNMLRAYRSGKYYFGSESKALQTQLKNSGINIESIFKTDKQEGKPYNSVFTAGFEKYWALKNPVVQIKSENLENPFLQWLNLTCTLETLGFCGFYPGQGIWIQGGTLFDGKFIIKGVTHSISVGSFMTTSEMMLLEPSGEINKLFK
jgi:hypothetical protein